MNSARIWPLAALLAGCTVGPDYHPPEMAVPARFAEAAPVAGPARSDDWWTAFGDPELDRLIAIALAESPDIAGAASRVRQARLGVASARAQLLPQIGAQGNVTNLNFSKNAGISQLASLFGGGGSSQSGGIAIPGGGITTYAPGFDASWEIDLFGGTRRRIESARAAAQEAQWSARDATLSLIAEIASQYFQLRAAQSREQVVRAQIANQGRSSQITGETRQVGLVPGGEDQRQRSQLATVQATVEPIIVDERIQIHALAVLVGRDPAAMSDELAVVRPLPEAVPAIPPGLPSELLRRRPDIRAAERKLAAATADIGVATADLYPKFNLTGTAQLISTQLSNLVSIDSKQTNASAAVSFPLLDFGRIRSNIRAKREIAEQAWRDYQKTVLTALRDVEDALTRIQGEQDHNRTLRGGLQSAIRAYAAADARFRVGLTDQTQALAAQLTVLQARQAVIDSDGLLRTDLVSLDKALGGGWQALPDVPDTLEPQRPYLGERRPSRK